MQVRVRSPPAWRTPPGSERWDRTTAGTRSSTRVTMVTRAEAPSRVRRAASGHRRQPVKVSGGTLFIRGSGPGANSGQGRGFPGSV